MDTGVKPRYDKGEWLGMPDQSPMTIEQIIIDPHGLRLKGETFEIALEGRVEITLSGESEIWDLNEPEVRPGTTFIHRFVGKEVSALQKTPESFAIEFGADRIVLTIAQGYPESGTYSFHRSEDDWGILPIGPLPEHDQALRQLIAETFC